MEQLLQLDEALFYFINDSCKNDFLDWVLPYWRNRSFWMPFYLIGAIALIYQLRKKSWGLFLGIFLVVGMADVASSHIIKNQVQRIRPCNQEVFKKKVHLLVPCGSGYSFTSSHATNHFALATFLIMAIGRQWRWIRLPLFLWALSIALAQVYVGVHYPLDVLFGGLLGGLIGCIGAFLVSYFTGRNFFTDH